MAERRQALIVLGMHRSGTSALTRVLNLCGATLPKHLMEPVEKNNETGFWESQTIMKLNDELLSSLKSTWDDISLLPENWVKATQIETYKKRLLASLEEEFETSELLVIKDPRVCRLLPLWIEVLDLFAAQPKVVIPIRNPLEVAASLSKRDNFTYSKSLLLWLQHFLCAERDTRNIPRTFISYSNLLDNWHGVVNQIAIDLDLSFSNISQVTGAEIEAFLDKGLRHHIISQAQVSRSDIIDWVVEVYDWGMKAVNGQVPDIKALDIIYGRYLEADRAFGPIVFSLSKDIEQINQKHRQLHIYFQEDQVELRKTQHQLQQFKTELQKIQNQFQQDRPTQHQLQEANNELQLTQHQLQEANNELQLTQHQLQEANNELQLTQHQLQEANNELQLTQHQLQEAKDDIGKLLSELADIKAILNKTLKNPFQKLNQLWSHWQSTKEID